MISTLQNPKGPALEKLDLEKRGVEMHPVESSNITAIGFSPGPGGKPGNLYVDFKSGTRYVYADVPAEEFAALLAADSPGRYHAGRIKGVYGYHKAEKSL